MRRRGVPDDAATEVLDRFGEVGLIDDAAFAEAWVTSRQAGRGLAPRALANELRERGVSQELIADALGRVDSDDVESAARDLVTRRARSSVGLPTQVRMRRLVAMLNRKGYSGELAVRVVREVLAVDDSDADERPRQRSRRARPTAAPEVPSTPRMTWSLGCSTAGIRGPSTRIVLAARPVA